MERKELFFDEMESEIYSSFDKPFNPDEENGKTALICESSPVKQVAIRTILERMGYYVKEASTPRESIRYMRHHPYRLIVVNERFDTESKEDNGVLEYISDLPMNVRRDIFVVMLSGEINTMENMAAFAANVNLIINLDNLDDAQAIIERGIAENEAFYSTFKSAMKEAGYV